MTGRSASCRPVEPPPWSGSMGQFILRVMLLKNRKPFPPTQTDITCQLQQHAALAHCPPSSCLSLWPVDAKRVASATSASSCSVIVREGGRGKGAEAACKERAVLGEERVGTNLAQGITHHTARQGKCEGRGAEKGSMHGGCRPARGAQGGSGKEGSTWVIDNMLIRAGLEAHSAAGTRGGSQARSWWELQRCDTRSTSWQQGRTAGRNTH